MPLSYDGKLYTYTNGNANDATEVNTEFTNIYDNFAAVKTFVDSLETSVGNVTTAAPITSAPSGVYFMSPWLDPAGSTTGVTFANLIISTLIYCPNGIDRLFFYCDAYTSSTKFYLGLMNAQTNSALPGTLKVGSAELTVTSTGLKEISVTTTLTSPWVWATLTADGTGASVRCNSGSVRALGVNGCDPSGGNINNTFNTFIKSLTYATIPSSISYALSNKYNQIPWIGAYKA